MCFKKLAVFSVDKLVRRVSVLSGTQSYAGVLVHPCIMVVVSELLYRDGFCPYYGIPVVLGPSIPCSVRVHSLSLLVTVRFILLL